MYLSRIELNHFRNFKKLKLKLSPNINIFIGNNAQGKTNILESIYVLALTKSHRYGVENNLIYHGYESSKVKGILKVDKSVKELMVFFQKNKKQVFINDKEIRRLSDYIFNMKVIMFCPDDLDIIKGSPADRRNLINIQISQLFENYAPFLNEYNKILKNRNEYLKIMNTNSYADSRYLDILNEKLIERAVDIYKYRKIYMDYISKMIGDFYKNITGIDGLNLSYETNLDLKSFEDDEIRDNLSRKLKSNIKREMLQGTTLYGPHRDDFSFYINNDDIKLYGSQGQQRSAIIAYKLSEIYLFKEITRTTPILLLDDIFSELDLKKRNNLIKYIPDDVQTIITTTDLKNIQKKLVDRSNVFIVDNGNIIEKEGKDNGKY
ncbi:MAG: DNA replication/repair protein RecF [Firmicutes bacterium]|nr:DNA replication/repair protein RecF [Bacillota bacterium]